MNPRYLIVVLAALSMLGALSIDAYLPALPAITAEFGATKAAAQQTLTVYLCAFAFMNLFYGMLSDSFGRRPVLLLSMLFYVLSSIGAGLSTSLSMLCGFRFLQGMTAGAGGTLGRAVVGDLFKGAEAQRMLSWIMVVFGLAPAIAPIIGGWLEYLFGWRYIFGFIALFTLILLVICWRGLAESLPKDHRHPFHFGTIVANYIHVGACPPFMLMSLSTALSFTGVMLYVAAAPVFIMDLLHLKVTEFAWLFVPLIGGMTFGSWVAGKVSHSINPRTLVSIGYVIMLASTGGNVYLSYAFAPAVPWAVIPIGIYSFGMALAMPAAGIITLEMFPRHRGLAASLQGFLFMFVFAIGSGIICPLLFDSTFHLALGVVAGLILSAACWWIGSALPFHSTDDLIVEE